MTFTAPADTTDGTVGLYISVPFCQAKCTFCNFASNVYGVEQHAHYVSRICEDLRHARGRAEAIDALLPHWADSVYLGGGTPSVLAPGLLRQIFATIHDAFRVDDAAEITVECAPGQMDDAFIEAMVECGVNRVSLGVQSFIDQEAAAVGRLHDRAIALVDIARLRAAGISNLSVDLIAGLPHQTLASWQESLEVLTGTGVPHASVYMLEIDDDSRLGREMLAGGARYHAGAVPKDDTIATMFEQAGERLAAAGLHAYEISNYAVVGQESKHNFKYWRRESYLGVGLDAHSMLRHTHTGRGVRFHCDDDLNAFMDGETHWLEFDHLTARAELEEAWFLGLRLTDGISRLALEAALGQAEVARFDPVVGDLVEAGLLRIAGDRVELTSTGKLISNEVFGRILEAGDEELCLAN